jgi:hypothetical protein
MISNAASVPASRRCVTSNWRRNRAISACSGVGRPTLAASAGAGRQQARVTQPTPLADLRGVQALPAQIRPALVLLTRLLVGLQMVKLLSPVERTPTARTTRPGMMHITHRAIIGDERGAGHALSRRLARDGQGGTAHDHRS